MPLLTCGLGFSGSGAWQSVYEETVTEEERSVTVLQRWVEPMMGQYITQVERCNNAD